MAEIPVTSLTIGIAATPDDRRRLARLLGDTEAFLIVSSVDQARKFLDIVSSPESTTVPAARQAIIRDADPGSVAGDAVFAGGVAGDEVIARSHPGDTAVPYGRPDDTIIARGAVVTAALAAVAADGTGTSGEIASPEPPQLRVDSDRRVLRWQDREIDLTPLEHDFLSCLVASPGQIWTYKRLHLEVWGNEHLGRGSDLHSVVRRVRRKLAWLGASAHIQSVRGVGFRYASH
ncbi:winged helix-turn-helix domain-containing protein [Catenuloplanes sp. NPDC051500]|uniref:winged helix-turn-helix domain-containing protein n=1 Tax=Catenuloplanes sp. NPDC051500 TaxID=3363959 RepID=UPI00379EC8D8